MQCFCIIILYYLNNFNVIFVELHFILYYSPFIFPFFYYFPAQLLAQAKNCCNKLVNPTKKIVLLFTYVFHIFSLQLRLQCRMNVFP